jgi:hypothetical protein
VPEVGAELGDEPADRHRLLEVIHPDTIWLATRRSWSPVPAKSGANWQQAERAPGASPSASSSSASSAAVAVLLLGHGFRPTLGQLLSLPAARTVDKPREC